jgi:ATP-dependent DNA ligase
MSVIDGEAVIWNGGRLDFDAMQRRLSGGLAGAARLACLNPASFAAFDMLAVAGQDYVTCRSSTAGHCSRKWQGSGLRR